MGDRRLVVFCSASNDIDPLYNRAAGEFVRRACAKGYEIVSGGTVKGTMGVISKEKMREGTCAAVALPGGIGTLDELVETLTLAKLGKYPGRIMALNIGGFYDKFIELLDFYVSTGMLDEASRKLISFPATVEELIDML